MSGPEPESETLSDGISRSTVDCWKSGAGPYMPRLRRRAPRPPRFRHGARLPRWRKDHVCLPRILLAPAYLSMGGYDARGARGNGRALLFTRDAPAVVLRQYFPQALSWRARVCSDEPNSYQH